MYIHIHVHMHIHIYALCAHIHNICTVYNTHMLHGTDVCINMNSLTVSSVLHVVSVMINLCSLPVTAHHERLTSHPSMDVQRSLETSVEKTFLALCRENSCTSFVGDI